MESFESLLGSFDIMDVPPEILASAFDGLDLPKAQATAIHKAILKSRSWCREEESALQSFTIPIAKPEELSPDDLLKRKKRQAVQSSEKRRRNR
jgi:hypothetical protein